MSFIKNKTKNLFGALGRKDSFTQNLAVTIFGTGLSFVIGFLFTPFIARIYGPEEYGMLALFNGFATNITIISSLGYINAFVLPKKENEFIGLVQLVLCLTIATSLLSLIIFAFWGEAILSYFDAETLGNWLYFIPVLVLIRGINMAWQAWNTRIKTFKRSAVAKVGSTIAGRSFILLYGWFMGPSPSGLILGGFLEQIIDTISKTSKEIRETLKIVFQFDRAQIGQSAKRFIRYPLYILPSNWLKLLIDLAPIFVLTRLHSFEFVGYYALANSLLGVPLSVIGMSSARVFYQKATETHQTQPERLGFLTKQLYRKLLLLGLLPFGILTVFGDYIFTILLGARWETAGIYAGFMGFYFMAKLIEFPLSSLYRVLNRERTLMIVTASIFSLLVGTFALVIEYANTPENLIIGFSSVMTVGFLASSFITLNMLKIEKVWLLIIKSIAYIVGTFAALYGLRFLLIYLFS
jgi:O-antigen/teichoic acid export membrane protein